MRPGLRIRIGDLEHARVGREAHRDRHLVLEMQRLAQASRLRARNELAEQDDALGVGRPLRRLLAECRVERIDERFGGRGHRELLPCVHRRPPLELSLPPSYAPRVLAFKLDLDAFLYLHRPGLAWHQFSIQLKRPAMYSLSPLLPSRDLQPVFAAMLENAVA